MNAQHKFISPGIASALGAALLFGAGTPLAKRLLLEVSPWLLAGLFYLGSGIGLSIFRLVSKAKPVRLPRSEVGWFAGAILAGGVVGPVLLMYGLSEMPASGTALLLNAEGVLTALLAWVVFKENFDHRIALGMFAIATGAVVLSWPEEMQFAGVLPALAVLGACLAWAVDNNLTRKVSLADATWIAATKGMVAGTVNLTISFVLGSQLPPWSMLAAAMVVGLLAYGISLVLFVVGLRHLGTARAGAYFSVAPFCGALIALAMGEPLTTKLLVAGTLMAIGIWLHLTEQHEHEHTHETMEHSHEHFHDDHHQHDHDYPVAPGVKHSHIHQHQPISHTHAHFPDVHHVSHPH